MKENKIIYFAKVKEDAIIPSKSIENAGYDIYACFEEDEITISPGEIKLIPTGIASVCSDDYYFQLQERGSTGTKGLSLRCGVIDSGFRNEWFVPINNTATKTIIIAKDIDKFKNNYYFGFEHYNTIYPYSKAICQAVLLPVPKVEVKEITYEELKNFKSERGLGALGSTNK
jgi:dUTP pyrophosphatase